MKVRDVMTPEPSFCSPDTQLREVAATMVLEDCGQIPICNYGSMRPIGVITDRDIVCRTVAKGINPLQVRAADCMSQPCVTVTPETSLDDCLELLEEHQVRRLPVVDENGDLCGIVSQADLARHGEETETGFLVKAVSERTQSASRRPRAL